MYKTDDILEAACTIRFYLCDLLGAESIEAIDQKLADLLSQANSGQPVDNLILELLAKQDTTREWMRTFLQDRLQPEDLRTFSPLPGTESMVNAPKFVCSQGDYIWYRPRVGIEPPLCPTHNLPLEQA
jgi:hypothetical protein